MNTQLLGLNGRLLMPILTLLLINLPVAEAKFEFPEGSMGNFALVGLIFTSITFGFGLKHQFIRGFRILFGRRPILSDVEGHERLRVSREWYHCAIWIASECSPAPNHALAEAAAARVIDVERQLFEEMPPPPRALPVKLYKSLLRTAKSFFPPPTSGDDPTNENSRRDEGEAPEPRIPPQPQSPPAQRGTSATTPQELGVLHFQAFVFPPRRSRLLALVRKLAATPPPPKDGGKIGFLYSSYTPRLVHQSRKSAHKRFFSRLLRALETPSTAPNSTISRRDKGKAPETRIPPEIQIPAAHTRKHKAHHSAKAVRRPKKCTHGRKSANTPKDGGKVGFLYAGYTPKPVPRLRSTHRWSKLAKVKCLFESEPVSRLFRAVENGFTPATSVDELTRENTRRNEGKAPELGDIPPDQFPILRRRKHRHRHRSTTATKDGGKKATHHSTKSTRRPKKSTHGSTKSGPRPRRTSAYSSAKSVRRPRESNHGHKSATTPKDGGMVGIHYAGYTAKPVPRLRSTREIFLSKLFIRLLRAVENGSATRSSTKSRRDKGKAPEPRIPPQPQVPTTRAHKHRSHGSAKSTHRPKKSSTHGHKSHGSAKSARRPERSAQGHKSAHTAEDGGEVGIHYVGHTPNPQSRHRSTRQHRESTPKSKHATTDEEVGKTRTHRSRRSSNHTAPHRQTPKTEQQQQQQDDVIITPPPKAYMAAATSSKQAEMPPEPTMPHPSLLPLAGPSPLIKFAPDVNNPDRGRARKPVPTALISVLDLAQHTVSRKPVVPSASASASSSSTRPDLSHSIPRKPVPSASS